VATVDELLRGEGLAGAERVSVSGGLRRPATVQLVERVEELGEAPAESMAFLGAVCAASTNGYEVDVGLRLAAARRVAAIVAPRSPENRWTEPSATALDIARRADIALVRLGPATPLGAGILAADRVIARQAADGLQRASAVFDHVVAAEAAGVGVPELLELASGLFGCPIETCATRCEISGALDPLTEVAGRASGTGVTRSRALEGIEPFVCARGVAAQDAQAARVLVTALAAVVARRSAITVSSGEVPLLSRSQLLNGLLFLDAAHREQLLAEARRLALPVEGWHIATCLEVVPTDGSRDGLRSEESRLALSEATGRVALRHCQGVGGTWTLTSSWTAIILVQMTTARPEPQRARRIVGALDAALDELAERFPAARARAGVGGAHEGLSGLRASLTEARVVLAGARTADGDPRVVAFDTYGIQRALVEWYASDPAQEAVAVQLAPLMALGGSRRDVAVRTLKTYLDEQGSLTRTSRALGLHRNAVAARLERIRKLMRSDLADPDERLALQLACRAYLVGAT